MKVHEDPRYMVWAGMKSRCLNSKTPGFQAYGARGIKVCDRWMIFENFAADMGPRPSPEHSIHRIDNDGHYEPGNCCWATADEQAKNKRNSRKIEFRGVTMVLSDWCKAMGVPYALIHSRLDNGWSTEEALTKPIRGSLPSGRRARPIIIPDSVFIQKEDQSACQ